MTARTRAVIGAAVVLVALATALILADLFGTVLFAITVAYVLTPVQGWFLERGWGRRRSAIATTTVAILAVIAVLVPIAVVAYGHRSEVAKLVQSVPDAFTVQAMGYEATLQTATVVDTIAAYVPTILLKSAVFLSAISVKFGVFSMVVFGLLVGHERARQAILAPIPPVYLPFVDAMEERARETLVAILVLQAGTAIGTFALAVPTFWLLGYDYAITLSAAAGALQFLPIIGPIVLLLALGAMHVVAGELVAAAIIVGVGGIVIGWLPDLLVRPRLARYTTGMPGSLYFVGFIGGITSLGVIGILAGPLFVALLVEGVDQLAAQMDHTDRTPITADADAHAAGAGVNDTVGNDATGNDTGAPTDAGATSGTGATTDPDTSMSPDTATGAETHRSDGA